MFFDKRITYENNIRNMEPQKSGVLFWRSLLFPGIFLQVLLSIGIQGSVGWIEHFVRWNFIFQSWAQVDLDFILFCWLGQESVPDKSFFLIWSFCLILGGEKRTMREVWNIKLDPISFESIFCAFKNQKHVCFFIFYIVSPVFRDISFNHFFGGFPKRFGSTQAMGVFRVKHKSSPPRCWKSTSIWQWQGRQVTWLAGCFAIGVFRALGVWLKITTERNLQKI